MEPQQGDPRAFGGRALLSAHPRARPFRKVVHVIYYLCGRNGQLEHPHFLELPHLPNHHPRLKDVMQRLTVLRGTAVASLYSWSCKRAYKNGYVWNDLSENDVLHPSADGTAEYILKGSEIIPIPQGFGRRTPVSPPATQTRGTQLEGGSEEEVKGDDEETPNSASSSGGGASTASSEDTEGSGGPSSPLGRRVPSVVMRLIACGSSAAAKGRAQGQMLGRPSEEHVSGVGVFVGEEGKPRSGDRHVAVGRECFRASMAEGIVDTERGGGSGPLIVRSTLYDEERIERCGLGESTEKEKREGERSVIKGKCMPSRSWMRSSAACKE